MGTDIHANFQFYHYQHNSWVDVEYPDYITKRMPYRPFPKKYRLNNFHNAHPMWINRDYAIFSLLCGVRRSGYKVIPITTMKGLPEGHNLKGADGGLYTQNGRFMGRHGFSWVTLKELIEYPFWDGDIGYCGYIKCIQYNDFIANNRRPREWAMDITGLEVYKFTEQEWLAECKLGSSLSKAKYDHHWEDQRYVWVEWNVPCKENWVYKTLGPVMLEMAKDRNLEVENVRMVFGFDS